MGGSLPRSKRRIYELAGTIALISVIIWRYGGLAPRVIIVLSFLLSLAVALVQLPFLAGFYGRRHFKPALIVLIVALPFLISLGYEVAYHKKLLALFAEEWLGDGQAAVSVMAFIALPALSFLAGSLSRKYLRK